jgi:hypothetical protein
MAAIPTFLVTIEVVTSDLRAAILDALIRLPFNRLPQITPVVLHPSERLSPLASPPIIVLLWLIVLRTGSG